jgi:hypothetical protein
MLNSSIVNAEKGEVEKKERLVVFCDLFYDGIPVQQSLK